MAKVLKEASKYSIPTAISAILSLALIPVISRIYPADQYGIINLFYSVGNLIMVFSLFGLDNALIRFYQRPLKGLDNRRAISLSLMVALVAIFLGTTIGCLAFPSAVTTFLFAERYTFGIVLLGFFSASLVIFRLLSVITRQEFDAFGYNIQQIALILSTKVLFVVAVVVSTGYQTSILFLTLFTLLFSLLFSISYARKFITLSFLKAPKESVRKFLKFALPTMPAALLMWLNGSLAKLTMASLGTFGDVGVFALAFTIANAFSVVPAAFSVYWSPFMYKHYVDSQRLIMRMQELITALAVVLVLVFLGIQDIIYFMVGSEYARSQSYFMLLMLTPIQTLLVETVGYGIYLENKTYLRLIVTGASAAVNFVACYILIPNLGGLGAAIALAASSLVMLCGSYVYGQRYYPSVKSKPRTMAAYSLIVALCVGNYWASTDIGLRWYMIGIGVAATVLLYGRSGVGNIARIVNRNRQ